MTRGSKWMVPVPSAGKAGRISVVDQPRLFRTALSSAQLELWELDDEQWRKVRGRPYARHAGPGEAPIRLQQLPLPELPERARVG
jgi:hypothetical protein